MGHRHKNLGQSRNRTHVIKPANLPNRGVSIVIKKGTEPITYVSIKAPVAAEVVKTAKTKWVPETK
jgi:hypothetical protein